MPGRYRRRRASELVKCKGSAQRGPSPGRSSKGQTPAQAVKDKLTCLQWDSQMTANAEGSFLSLWLLSTGFAKGAVGPIDCLSFTSLSIIIIAFGRHLRGLRQSAVLIWHLLPHCQSHAKAGKETSNSSDSESWPTHRVILYLARLGLSRSDSD